MFNEFQWFNQESREVITHNNEARQKNQQKETETNRQVFLFNRHTDYLASANDINLLSRNP